MGGGRYASAHEVSPFGFQENVSFSAFATICFGAKALKHAVRQDGCGVLFCFVFFYRGAGTSRPPPTDSPHPPLIQACALEHGTRRGPRLYVSPPRVTAVCQGLCSLVQMAQPVAPLVPKLPALIDQGQGSHGLGNVDLLL